MFSLAVTAEREPLGDLPFWKMLGPRMTPKSMNSAVVPGIPSAFEPNEPGSLRKGEQK